MGAYYTDAETITLGKQQERNMLATMRLLTKREKPYAEDFYDLANNTHGDDKKWLDLIGKAANLGHRRSQYLMGWNYELGLRGLYRNERVAADYYFEALAQGCIESMSRLAILYYSGRGVQQNIPKAIDYYTELATQYNCPGAQYELATIYLEGWDNGKGIDLKKAEYWLQKACAQGDLVARGRLQEMDIEPAPMEFDDDDAGTEAAA